MIKHTISLAEGEYFSPDKTFNCGQCFRFDKTADGWQGIVKGDLVIFPDVECEGKIEYYSVNGTDLSDFLDLSTSYNEINRGFENFSPIVKSAVDISRGLRILKQDFHEALFSFIISQNNNIPRIKNNVATISARFGERIRSTNHYAFPSPEALLDAGDAGLGECRLGFRTKYILDAAKKCVTGEITPEALPCLSDDEAREYLMKIHGVGPKVASCVLLYGAHRLSAVPVDVWMKKIFQKYFNKDFADLGYSGGVLQQYLFFRERFIIEGKKI